MTSIYCSKFISKVNASETYLTFHLRCLKICKKVSSRTGILRPFSMVDRNCAKMLPLSKVVNRALTHDTVTPTSMSGTVQDFLTWRDSGLISPSCSPNYSAISDSELPENSKTWPRWSAGRLRLSSRLAQCTCPWNFQTVLQSPQNDQHVVLSRGIQPQQRQVYGSIILQFSHPKYHVTHKNLFFNSITRTLSWPRPECEDLPYSLITTEVELLQ